MPEYDLFDSPEALLAAYDGGFPGVIEDEAEMRALRDFEAENWPNDPLAALHGTGENALAIPYTVACRLDPGFGTERQETGDCVSHYVRNAVQLTASIETLSQPEMIPARFATEPIYWARGHAGAGANCGRLARFVTNRGGILLRKKYDELGIDLTQYSGRNAKRWGASLPPEAVLQECRLHQVVQLHFIKSLEEARDSLANGYGCGGCSGYSFSNRRDEWGVSDRTRQGWSHAMAWIGFDDRPATKEKYGEALVCVQQSWGNWNSGGWHADYGPAPLGAFWIRARHAAGMISGGGIIAFSNFGGFRRRGGDYVLY